jgi:hypothetical protein
MAPAVWCWPQPLMPVHMRSLIKWWWDRLFFKHFRFYPVNKHNSYQKNKQAKPADLLSTALLEDGKWFLSASIHEAIINRYINFENILEVTWHENGCLVTALNLPKCQNLLQILNVDALAIWLFIHRISVACLVKSIAPQLFFQNGVQLDTICMI